MATRGTSLPEHTPTARLAPDDLPHPLTPEEELEEHLDEIHASRRLRRAARKASVRTRRWTKILAVVSGLAVTAGCLAGTYIVLQEKESGPPSQPLAAVPQGDDGGETAEEGSMLDHDPNDVVDPIAARDTDPDPLTVDELFGPEVLTPNGSERGYTVIGQENLKPCTEAVIGDLADLVEQSACTQTVRATARSDSGDFLITLGVMNLSSDTEAESITEQLNNDLEGGFSALRVDGMSSDLGRSDTMVGYSTYGHYLLYAVVGRSNGEALNEETEAVRTIVNDLVDTWLVDRLLPRRDLDGE